MLNDLQTSRSLGKLLSTLLIILVIFTRRNEREVTGFSREDIVGLLWTRKSLQVLFPTVFRRPILAICYDSE